MFRSTILAHQRQLIVAGAASSGAMIMMFGYCYNGTDNDYLALLEPQQKDPSSSSNTRYHPPQRLPTRQEQVQRLMDSSSSSSSTTKTFDVLVVGGGCTGSGVALDAASRGLSTALIEKGDFGNETSARSTKLIWAGIRYIGTALAALLQFSNSLRPAEALSDFVREFQMVRGAHAERKILLENNPHLTNWVPICVPIPSLILWPPPMGHPLFATAPCVLPLVMKFYDSLSGFTCPPSHIMSLARSRRKFPQLADDHIKYFQIFYEGQHNDARTNTCIALTAAEEGATIANHVEMIGLLRGGEDNEDQDKDGKTKNKNNKKAVGIICRDNLSGREFQIHAKSIIFCGGPFTDDLRRIEDPQCPPAVAAAAGTHIVLPGYYCPGGIGMLDIQTSDGRFLFYLPWQGATLVGTTDRKGMPVSDHGPPESEIQWILQEVQKYLSDEFQVRREDVRSAWQGFRPLASDPHAPPGAPVSRDHVISTNPDTGVTFVTGGKWTTYRQMAQEVVDHVVSSSFQQQEHGERQDDDADSPKTMTKKVVGPCVTATRPLRGGVGYHRNLPIRLVQEYGVSEETAKHLARTYGMHAFEVCALAAEAEPNTRSIIYKQQEPSSLSTWPLFAGRTLMEGFPYLECEVAYACRHEMACTLRDMLTLRFRIAYINKEAALAVAPRVADLMAKELQWSRRERNRQLRDALDLIQTFGGPSPNE